MCNKMIKVTCQVYTWISDLVEKSLFEAGIVNYHIQSGRNVVIREKHYLGGLITKTKYENAPADIFRFFIPFEYESAIMNHLIKKCEFHHPGRGTVFTEEVTLYNSELLHFDFDKSKNPDIQSKKLEKLWSESNLNLLSVELASLQQESAEFSAAWSVRWQEFNAETVKYNQMLDDLIFIKEKLSALQEVSYLSAASVQKLKELSLQYNGLILAPTQNETA